MRPTTRTAAWRLLTPLIVLALLASALYFTARGASGNDLTPEFSLDQTYINYAAPYVQPSSDGKEVKGKDGVFRPAGNSAFRHAPLAAWNVMSAAATTTATTASCTYVSAPSANAESGASATGRGGPGLATLRRFGRSVATICHLAQGTSALNLKRVIFRASWPRLDPSRGRRPATHGQSQCERHVCQ